MKYKYFSILFLALLLLCGDMTFAVGTKSLGKNQKPWWSNLVPESIVLPDSTDVEKEISDLSLAQKRLSILEKIYTDKIEHIEQNTSYSATEVNQLQQMQKNLQAKIRKNKIEQQLIVIDLAGLQREIDELKKSHEKTQKVLKNILVRGYKENIDKNTDQSSFGLIFGKTFGNEIRDNESSSILHTTAQGLYLREQAYQEKLLQLKEKVQIRLKAKESYIDQIKEYRLEFQVAENIEQQLTQRYIFRSKALKKNMKKIEEKKQDIHEKLQIKIKEYDKLMHAGYIDSECEKMQKNKESCDWLKQYMVAEKSLREQAKNDIIFSWPLSPEKGFGYAFRDQAYFNKHKTHHEGLDMITSTGDTVYAMSDGYILYREAPSKKSPGILIIKYTDGYISVYTGINPGSKTVFSLVQGGEEVGKSDAFSDHSEVKNVHVELYNRDKNIDPLEKLDMSLLPLEQVPTKYGWKYVDDLRKKQKNVSINELQKKLGFFFIDGENKAERQKNLLKKYAPAKFGNRNDWVEASIAQSIEPSFTICVGFAESSLGKNLTTEGNIGNVGNTDGGDRKSFDSPKSGISAISAVVNNNWLGGYATIDQLSGWGNNRGPIYASSQTNWHENVTKCMSALEARYVGNEAPFRLSEASLLLYEQEGFLIQ